MKTIINGVLFEREEVFQAWKSLTPQQMTERIVEQDRFIAVLEARIDTLQKDKQNTALEYLSLEGQCREMSAELIELRELVGVHKEQRDGPQYPNPEEIKAAGDEATPATAKSPT